MSVADDFDRSAARFERLAVVVRAGLAPAAAWSEIVANERPSDERQRSRVWSRRSATARDTLADSVVQAFFAVTMRAGAPLGPALRSQAAALRERAQQARESEIAATGPRMTARVLLALPAGGSLLAVALGFDVVGALTGTPIGIAALVGGLLLAALGALWTRRLVASVNGDVGAPGLVLDLAAVAVLGGLPPAAAIAMAVDAVPHAMREEGDEEAASAAIAFARTSGAPVTMLLVEEAAVRRRRAAAEAQKEVERLGTRLLAPLGVCVLPSFLLLGVLPVLTAVVSSTIAAS